MSKSRFRSHDSGIRRCGARLLLLAAAVSIVLATLGCTPVEPFKVPSAVPATRQPSPPATGTAAPEATPPMTFAVIGDYGSGDAHERAVADLVASWDPAFVITTGDDYYSQAGGSGTARYDESTGRFYGPWLKDISTTGKRLPVGPAPVNAFFPSMGNHDYSDARPSPRTYLTYFDLPGEGFASSSGNERYYDFVEGPVHFFVLNSNTMEPAGTSSASAQARWLKGALAASTSVWNVVYDHHPPYSSDSTHGSTRSMRWPFAEWGADVVVSGHAHVYERVMRDGIVYFVNGLGGASRYGFGTPVSGSAVRYRGDWGAQRATATETTLTFEFVSVSGVTIDEWTISAKGTPGN